MYYIVGIIILLVILWAIYYNRETFSDRDRRVYDVAMNVNQGYVNFKEQLNEYKNDITPNKFVHIMSKKRNGALTIDDVSKIMNDPSI